MKEILQSTIKKPFIVKKKKKKKEEKEELNGKTKLPPLPTRQRHFDQTKDCNMIIIVSRRLQTASPTADRFSPR